MVWKVRYTDVETMQARMPFFKHTAYVEADSKKDARERVGRRWPAPKYRVQSASPAPEKKADYGYY